MKHVMISVLAIISILAISSGAFAGEDVSFRKAKLTKLEGQVLVRAAGVAEWSPAQEDMVLGQNDEIATTKTGSVTVVFDEEGTFQFNGKEHDYVEMMPDTNIVIAKLTYNNKTRDKETLLNLTIGKIAATASKLRTKDSRFEVKTPTSIVGVRGTRYIVEYRPPVKP